jgi:hypothetical protein
VNAPRIGLVGARRGRQGLGPFVARLLVQAGAEVPCFLCTSDATVRAADEELQQLAHVNATGYVDGERMLAEQRLDALAILTPAATHRAWLERALEAGLSVLCEKPFVWGAPDDLAATDRLVQGFADRDLVLMENCQWPAALTAYHELHPQAYELPMTRFAMRLSPAHPGVEMLGDALSHPLSVLQSLRPSEVVRIEQPHFSTKDPAAEELALRFRYMADEHAVDVLVELSLGPNQPREASLAVNGHWAHRLIRTSDYALFFASGARVVDLPDPLAVHLARFVARLRAEPPRVSATENLRIRQRMSALDLLRIAFLENSPQ